MHVIILYTHNTYQVTNYMAQLLKTTGVKLSECAILDAFSFTYLRLWDTAFSLNMDAQVKQKFVHFHSIINLMYTHHSYYFCLSNERVHF